MSSGEAIVSYRCTIKTCKGHLEGGRNLPTALEDGGCPFCGCKRLEILDHPTRGHFIVDWRSQKSVRKRARRRAA